MSFPYDPAGLNDDFDMSNDQSSSLASNANLQFTNSVLPFGNLMGTDNSTLPVPDSNQFQTYDYFHERAQYLAFGRQRIQRKSIGNFILFRR